MLHETSTAASSSGTQHAGALPASVGGVKRPRPTMQGTHSPRQPFHLGPNPAPHHPASEPSLHHSGWHGDGTYAGSVSGASHVPLPLTEQDVAAAAPGQACSEASMLRNVTVQNMLLDEVSESTLLSLFPRGSALHSPDAVPALPESLRQSLAGLHDKLFGQSPGLGQHPFVAMLTGLLSQHLGVRSPSCSLAVQSVLGQVLAASSLPVAHVVYWYPHNGHNEATPIFYGSQALFSLFAVSGADAEALPFMLGSSLASTVVAGHVCRVQQHHPALHHLHGPSVLPRLRAVTRSVQEQAALFTFTGTFLGGSGPASRAAHAQGGTVPLPSFMAQERVTLMWSPWASSPTLDGITFVYQQAQPPPVPHSAPLSSMVPFGLPAVVTSAASNSASAWAESFRRLTPQAAAGPPTSAPLSVPQVPDPHTSLAYAARPSETSTAATSPASQQHAVAGAAPVAGSTA